MTVNHAWGNVGGWGLGLDFKYPKGGVVGLDCVPAWAASTQTGCAGGLNAKPAMFPSMLIIEVKQPGGNTDNEQGGQ